MSTARTYAELSDLFGGIVLDPRREMPLYAQLRQSLRRIILNDFKDQDQFVPENELAAGLGVSPGTVRRALGDLASEGLLVRRPSRGTIICKPRSQQMKNLGIFFPDFSSSGISQVLDLVTGRCRQQEINPWMLHTHRGERLSQAYEQLHFAPNEGGVLLMHNTPRATQELYEALTDRGYACVTLDQRVPDRRSNFVCVQNEEGVRIGVEHLAALGHRRIAFLAAESFEKENVQERTAAFRGVAAELGLSEVEVVDCHTPMWTRSSLTVGPAMEKLWSRSEKPTAIFGITDTAAAAAIRWLTQQGISVPGEVSVLGFDGNDFGAEIFPPLTTVAQPYGRMVDAAFRILTERKPEPVVEFFAPTLLERGSTASLHR